MILVMCFLFCLYCFIGPPSVLPFLLWCLEYEIRSLGMTGSGGDFVGVFDLSVSLQAG